MYAIGLRHSLENDKALYGEWDNLPSAERVEIIGKIQTLAAMLDAERGHDRADRRLTNTDLVSLPRMANQDAPH